MEKVFCFGEILMRFAPDVHAQWLENNQVPVFVGGAELNVATALSLWGMPAAYLSAMPVNALTKQIEKYIIDKNIDVTPMQWMGSRIGTYYLTQGADLKNAAVIYDRAWSSFSELKTGTINWAEMFEGCDWFHFSAITPALSESLAELCLEAVQAASALGLTISVDLNYRASLWKYGKQPVEVMPVFLPYCEVVMGNIWAANNLLGISLNEELINKNNEDSYVEHAAASAKEMFEKYEHCKYIANTFRFDAGDGIHYYATAHSREENAKSSVYQCEQVINKVGSGDCFMAGLIYNLKKEESLATTINFAAAAAFAKLQQKGDATTSTLEAVQKSML